MNKLQVNKWVSSMHTNIDGEDGEITFDRNWSAQQFEHFLSAEYDRLWIQTIDAESMAILLLSFSWRHAPESRKGPVWQLQPQGCMAQWEKSPSVCGSENFETPCWCHLPKAELDGMAHPGIPFATKCTNLVLSYSSQFLQWGWFWCQWSLQTIFCSHLHTAPEVIDCSEAIWDSKRPTIFTGYCTTITLSCFCTSILTIETLRGNVEGLPGSACGNARSMRNPKVVQNEHRSWLEQHQEILWTGTLRLMEDSCSSICRWNGRNLE